MRKGLPYKSIAPEGVRTQTDLVKEFKTESDRAAGVLAGAYLDAFLEDLLRELLVPGAQTDAMFDMPGPLGSFASKIGLAFALGVSDDEIGRDMNLIRKVRNHFAHNLWEARFDAPPVSQWCSELRIVDHYLDPSRGQPTQSPRERYLASIGLCVLRLVQSPKVAQLLRGQMSNDVGPGAAKADDR